MPKITSTVTRKQSEAVNIPPLPKPWDEMTGDEKLSHLAMEREHRRTASDKRKASRKKAKSGAEAGKAVVVETEPANGDGE